MGLVGQIDFFFNIFFFILQFSECGFWALFFVIFLYLLTILNTLSSVIDDINPYSSRGRQNFQDIKNFPIKRFRVGLKKIGSVGGTVNARIFLGA
jgi:hypothetical protein